MLQQVVVSEYVQVVDYQDEGNAVPGEGVLLPARSGFILLNDMEVALFTFLKEEMIEKGLFNA